MRVPPLHQVVAFGKDMKKLGLTDQRIVTIGKQLIRSRIIQTQAIFEAGSGGKGKREWTGEQEQQLRKLAKRKRTHTGFSDDDTQLVEPLFIMKHLLWDSSSYSQCCSGATNYLLLP